MYRTTVRSNDQMFDIRPGGLLEIPPGDQCRAPIAVDWSFTDTTQCCREIDHDGPHCLVSFSGLVIYVDPRTADSTLDRTPTFSPKVKDFMSKVASIAAEVTDALWSAETGLMNLRIEVEDSEDLSADERQALGSLIDEFRLPSDCDVEPSIDPNDSTEWYDVLYEHMPQR